ncbi:MAG: hypothetical protein WDZ28_00420 [Simkaniaceae bacterium]
MIAIGRFREDNFFDFEYEAEIGPLADTLIWGASAVLTAVFIVALIIVPPFSLGTLLGIVILASCMPLELLLVISSLSLLFDKPLTFCGALPNLSVGSKDARITSLQDFEDRYAEIKDEKDEEDQQYNKEKIYVDTKDTALAIREYLLENHMAMKKEILYIDQYGKRGVVSESF